jgi:hypothetical protein
MFPTVVAHKRDAKSSTFPDTGVADVTHGARKPLSLVDLIRPIATCAKRFRVSHHPLQTSRRDPATTEPRIVGARFPADCQDG